MASRLVQWQSIEVLFVESSYLVEQRDGSQPGCSKKSVKMEGVSQAEMEAENEWVLQPSHNLAKRRGW